MKKIITLIVLVFMAGFSTAQTNQSGYVKTKGRLDDKGNLIPGQRLSGVAIVLTNGHSVVSDANGNFVLSIPEKSFFLKDVQKNGYTIVDPEMLKKQYAYSANPLVITMETPSQQIKDQVEAQKKIENTLRKQLQQREQELEALKDAHRITEEEYYKKLQQLYNEMAKRYAEIDYDLIDDFQQQLRIYIINGELAKADSLLNSKGNIFDDIAALDNIRKTIDQESITLDSLQKNLKASLQYELWRCDNLAQLCADKAKLFIDQQQLDSAAYYMELRAKLDTTNMDWQLEAGRFMLEQMNAPSEALPYYRRVLNYLEHLYGWNHPQVEFLSKEIERISLMYEKYNSKNN